MLPEIIITPLELDRYVWIVEIEHGTVLESCAIDALLFLHKTHGDYYTYATYDKHEWADFEKFKIGRSKAINKEFMKQYS